MYGKEAHLKTEINAFRPGSFGVEFTVHAGAIATLFGIANAKKILETIKGAIEVWKALRGESPQAITRVDQNRVEIKTNYGQVINVRAESVTLVTDPNAANAASRFVRVPLGRDVDLVEVEHNGHPLIAADASEAEYVGVLVPVETLTENIVEMWLALVSPVFKQGNQWRFSDGQSTFYATIADQKFLDRVARREVRFGQDDAFLVKMQIRQTGTAVGFKAEGTIVEVVEHRPAPVQGNL